MVNAVNQSINQKQCIAQKVQISMRSNCTSKWGGIPLSLHIHNKRKEQQQYRCGTACTGQPSVRDTVRVKISQKTYVYVKESIKDAK